MPWLISKSVVVEYSKMSHELRDVIGVETPYRFTEKGRNLLTIEPPSEEQTLLPGVGHVPVEVPAGVESGDWGVGCGCAAGVDG